MMLAAFAGTATYTGQEMKQAHPAPCPEWYADTTLWVERLRHSRCVIPGLVFSF
jgi:hypothetical protein